MNILNNVILENLMFFDVAVRYQFGLQDSATYGMEMIVQLHNYVMYVNVFIISIVVWFFYEIFAVIGVLPRLGNFLISYNKGARLRLLYSAVIYKKIKNAMLHMPLLEVIWTLLPVLALISIALPSLSMLYYFSLSFKPLVGINVIGHQWYWSYEYFEDFGLTTFVKKARIKYNLPYYMYIMDVQFLDTSKIDSLKKQIIEPAVDISATHLSYESIMIQTEDLRWGRLRLLEVDKPLYLPIDLPIRVIVSSDDVLHSWAVPSLGVKIDCVPGRLNVVEFRIARAGIFYGQCSEICGTQHGMMPIMIISLPKRIYRAILLK